MERENYLRQNTAKFEPSKPQEQAHHWRIDEVAGPISEGICIGCGAVKEFRNWPEDELGWSELNRSDMKALGYKD